MGRRIGTLLGAGILVLGLVLTWFLSNYLYNLFWAYLDEHHIREADMIAYTLAHIVPFVLALVVVATLYLAIHFELTRQGKLVSALPQHSGGDRFSAIGVVGGPSRRTWIKMEPSHLIIIGIIGAAFFVLIAVAGIIWQLRTVDPQVTALQSEVADLKTKLADARHPKTTASQPVTALIAWPKEPTISHEMGPGGYGTYNADQFIIRAKNISDREIAIEDAYIISGLTGEKLIMKVEISNERGITEYLSLSDINPIPPSADIELVVNFTEGRQDGIPEQDFMSTWGKVDFVAHYDGGTEHRQSFDHETIVSVFQKMRPGTPLPRTTRKRIP